MKDLPLIEVKEISINEWAESIMNQANNSKSVEIVWNKPPQKVVKEYEWGDIEYMI